MALKGILHIDSMILLRQQCLTINNETHVPYVYLYVQLMILHILPLILPRTDAISIASRSINNAIMIFLKNILRLYYTELLYPLIR